MKSTNKTTPTDSSVDVFLSGLDEARRAESQTLVEVMQKITGQSAVMWGSSIIGFGSYQYKYSTGRQGEWMKIGFSPRKAAISLYLSCDLELFTNELSQLGDITHGKGCIYIKHLENVDQAVLEAMLKKAYTLADDYVAS